MNDESVEILGMWGVVQVYEYRCLLVYISCREIWSLAAAGPDFRLSPIPPSRPGKTFLLSRTCYQATLDVGCHSNDLFVAFLSGCCVGYSGALLPVFCVSSSVRDTSKPNLHYKVAAQIRLLLPIGIFPEWGVRNYINWVSLGFEARSMFVVFFATRTLEAGHPRSHQK